METKDYKELFSHNEIKELLQVWVREITPARKAMNHVIIGLALSTFTLNLIYLNYILPTIGIALILLGFPCLRRENVGFKACWILSIIRALYIFPWLIINASICNVRDG